MKLRFLSLLAVCAGFVLTKPCQAELFNYEIGGFISSTHGSTFFAPQAGVGSAFRATLQLDTSQGTTNPVQGGERTVYQNGFQVLSYFADDYNLTFDSVGNLGRLEVANDVQVGTRVIDFVRGTQVFIVDPNQPSTIEATLRLDDNTGTNLSSPLLTSDIRLSSIASMPQFTLNYWDYSQVVVTAQTLTGRIDYMSRLDPGGPVSLPILNGDFSQGLDGFQVSGPGTANVIDMDGNSVVQMTTGSPVVLSQMVNTPDAFTFSFDYLFQTMTGSLDVLLNGVTIDSITAPSMLESSFMTRTVTVTDPSLFNLTNVELAFLFDGPTGSQILIDNLTPLTGTHAANAVPEPASFALFGIGSLGMFLLRRRKDSNS